MTSDRWLRVGRILVATACGAVVLQRMVAGARGTTASGGCCNGWSFLGPCMVVMLAALAVFGGYRGTRIATLACSAVLLLVTFGFFAPGAEKLAHIDDGLEFEYPIFTVLAYWASVGAFVFVSRSAQRVCAQVKADGVAIGNDGDTLPPPPRM